MYRISFGQGETGTEIDNTIQASATHYYVLRAFEGQEMTVNISSP
jgi:hypothetical protein